MTQRLVKSTFVLFALGLLLFGSSVTIANDDDLEALNQRIVELFKQGKYQEAIPLAEKAVDITRRLRGPEHLDTAQSLSNLALLYDELGEYPKAEPFEQEALRIDQKVLGPEHPDTATSLNNLAGVYMAMGEYAKAEPLYQEALRIRQKVLGPERPDTVACLNNLALLYDHMGEYPKAEPLFQQALRICQKVLGTEHPDTAVCLDNLAILYKEMGAYAKAEPLFQQALRIRQKVLGPEHPDTATSLDSLAGLYDDMGEYPKAEPLYQQALRIRQKVLGPEHPDTAASLNNLATLYKEMGAYAKAEPLFQQALRIDQKVLGPEHPHTVSSLNNLAGLYDDMGEYAKAEPLYQRALAIREKALGPEHPDTATSFNNLALLYQEMGEYAKAEPLYQEALRIDKKVLGAEHPDTARVLENLALHDLDLGRVDEAKTLARQASAAQLAILSRNLSFASEQQRLAYLNIFHPYSLFPFLRGTEADLAIAVLRYKGVVLDSIVEDRLLAEASHGGEDQKRVEQLNVDKRRLGQLLLEPVQKVSAQTNQRIQSLEEEVEKIESDLAQHVADLGQARRALSVRLEQVQQAIPNDGVLIEYVRYSDYLGKGKWEPRYGAIVLAAAGNPIWVPLGPAAELTKLVSSYQKSARGQTDATKLESDLRALHDRLWSPVESALRQPCRRVILSPDGQLNFVSFATLLDAEHRFLAERYAVQYVASGRDLVREASPVVGHPRAAVFANPDFERLPSASLSTPPEGEGAIAMAVAGPRGAEKRGIEHLHFASLSGTQHEGDCLVSAFNAWHWNTEAFTGPQASKAALRQVHAPYVLHLATHGFFLEPPAPGNASALQPAVLSIEGGVSGSKFFENPMHRSGLVLAGAQRTLEAWRGGQVPPVDDDGIVTAEDVAALDLHGTWLVTVSACDTGSGEVKAGEGVLGLRRGFVEAGAQNLLMTLWPIDDRVTVQIMSDFYAAAHERGNAAQALAEVQREWLVALRDGQGEKFEETKAALIDGPGLAAAVKLAGPFILSAQGKP
jgi:tetratricopeptide (TPR) repeat protein